MFHAAWRPPTGHGHGVAVSPAPRARRRAMVVVALTSLLALCLPISASAAPLKATSFVRGAGSPGIPPTPPQRVIVGDLNGDGRDDAAFSSNTKVLTVLYGTTPSESVDLGAELGTRALRVTSPEDEVREVTAAGDVDRDGLDDLAVTTDTRAYVLYGARTNDGPLTLGSGPRFTTLTNRTTQVQDDIAGIGDFDGDGYDDLAVQLGGQAAASAIVAGGPRLSTIALGTTGGRVSMLAGRQWCTVVIITYQCTYRAVNFEPLGDFDGDGLDDLVIEGMTSDANVVLYGRTGRFTATPSAGAGKTRLPLPTDGERPDGSGDTTRAGDVNGDGLADVVVWDKTIVLGRRGRPSAINATDPLIQVTTTGDRAKLRLAPAGDQDGDGRDDLVASSFGSTTFTPRVLTPLPRTAPATVDADQGTPIPGLTLPVAEAITGGGDLDADGAPDLLVGTGPEEDSAWIVTRGSGTPSGARPAQVDAVAELTTAEGTAIPATITLQATCAGRTGPPVTVTGFEPLTLLDRASEGDACSVRATFAPTDASAWTRCTWVDTETNNQAPITPAGSSFTLAPNSNAWRIRRVCTLPIVGPPTTIGQPGWWNSGAAATFDPALGGGTVQLTTGPNQRASTMWSAPVDWRNRTVTFNLGMTAQAPTGEGVTLAFVRPDASGGPAGGRLGWGASLLGFGGLQGVAVAFDNRKSNTSDPSSNFIGFADGYSGTSLRWLQTAPAVSNLTAPSDNLIKVVNKAGITTVFVNGVQRMRGALAIPPESFIAFTGSTSSAGWQFQRIYNVTFTAS